MKLNMDSMLGLDIEGAIKAAVDRWVSEHVTEFNIGVNVFRIISIESVPDDEFWLLDGSKRNLLKFKLTAQQGLEARP